jgi:hypothetical protein
LRASALTVPKYPFGEPPLFREHICHSIGV